MFLWRQHASVALVWPAIDFWCTEGCNIASPIHFERSCDLAAHSTDRLTIIPRPWHHNLGSNQANTPHTSSVMLPRTMLAAATNRPGQDREQQGETDAAAPFPVEADPLPAPESHEAQKKGALDVTSFLRSFYESRATSLPHDTDVGRCESFIDSAASFPPLPGCMLMGDGRVCLPKGSDEGKIRFAFSGGKPAHDTDVF